jgi:lipid II:glycine glycyltransferase (peptidoglycan interpeptide bridge formation enzyme)
MLHLKALGFRVLDLGGFDPQDETSGVSRFKRGTNAVPYRLCSEIDAHSSMMKRSVIRRAIAVARTPIRIPLLPSGRAASDAVG